MDYYKLSDEPLLAAKVNKENGLYRMSVSMATLAIDMLFKSVLYRVMGDDNLIMGHNHLGLVMQSKLKTMLIQNAKAR